MLADRLLLAVLLAACRAKEPPPPPAPAPAPPRPPPAPAVPAEAIDEDRLQAEMLAIEAAKLAEAVARLPPLYGPIFAGRHPGFPGQTMFQYTVGIKTPRGMTTGGARCFVRPSLIPGAVVGSLTCAPYAMLSEVLLFTFDGDLIATPEGLWFEPFESITDAKHLDPKRMVLAAQPEPRRHERVDNERMRSTLVTSKHRDLWCITATGENTEYICLRDGEIAGGGGTGSGVGGSSKRTESWGATPTKTW